MTDSTGLNLNAPAAFWGWPGWRHLGLFALLAAAFGVWWVVIYFGANCLTDLHSYRVRLHFDFELQTPFVPWAVLGYCSVYLLLWSAPFILRTTSALVRLTAALAAITLFAGLCFLIFPADLHFPKTAVPGPWHDMVELAKRVALAHNLAPSLHVGLSVICVIVYARRAGRLGRALLWTWSVLIALSTLLLHQHYLIDVFTGYLLGWAGVWGVYDVAAPRPSGKDG